MPGMLTLPLAQSVTYNYHSNLSPVAVIAALLFGIGFFLAFYALIGWLLSNDVKAIPAEYRQNVTPMHPYLLMIPLFNLVWNFFLFPRIAASFAAYFEATGRPKPGDYGRGLSLAFAITLCCFWIPCLGSLCVLAGLVLLIILLVKFNGYKNEVLAGGSGGFPVQPTAM